MKGAVQLADLALRFSRGAVLRTYEIAGYYGVSQRTAQRWVATIDEELVRLVSDQDRWRKA